MSRRMDRVSVVLREEISRVLAREVQDPRLPSMVTVTGVSSSSDLRHAKVYVSVLGDESQKRAALKALKSAAGFVHRSVRQSLTLKTTPSLTFVLDESIERGVELLRKIEEVAPHPGSGAQE